MNKINRGLLYCKHILPLDFTSSITLFLVAIPMCLGVSLACGIPLISGLIAGIVGGFVVGILSGSHTSVSGPTPSVISVVIAGIITLGDYPTFLAAVCIAGLMQIAMGALKCGMIADFIPSSVIRGLLGAVGIIIVLKQVPYLVGYDADSEGSFSFYQTNGDNTFSAILKTVDNFHLGSVVLGVLTLVIIVLWDKIKIKSVNKMKFLVIAIPTAIALVFHHKLLMLDKHFVQIPNNISLSNIRSFIVHPNFSMLHNINVYIVAAMIAGVTSIETLLNIESADKIDPHKRRTNPNRELLAQGIGNVVSGILGGLPIASVILRTTVNINSGAKTKMSTIFHGILICVCIFSLPTLLNSIPLSVLAAVLIINGSKLIHLSVLKEMYVRGPSQFLPFIITLIAIVFTDLVMGVLIGLLIGVFFILKSSYKNPFRVSNETYHIEETMRIELPQQVSFLNKPSLAHFLYSIPPGANVTIDARKSDYIDYDIMELIREFKLMHAPLKKIKMNTFGFRKHNNFYKISERVQFSHIITKEIQQQLTPSDVLSILKRGNERFCKNTRISRELIIDARQSSSEQHPMAVVLGCIDSRTSSEMIFDLGFGDAFSIRIAGNVVNDDILGSIEYACKFAGAKLIVVLGHTNCGAIRSACDGVQHGNITGLINKIVPAVEASRDGIATSDADFIQHVTHINVENSKKQIFECSETIRDLVERKEAIIVGAIYDVASGKVTFDI